MYTAFGVLAVQQPRIDRIRGKLPRAHRTHRRALWLQLDHLALGAPVLVAAVRFDNDNGALKSRRLHQEDIREPPWFLFDKAMLERLGRVLPERSSP